MEISILILIDQFLFEIIYESLMFSTIQASTGSCLCELINYSNKMFAISFLTSPAGIQIPFGVHPGEQKVW